MTSRAKPLAAVIIGTRPEAIKLAPVILEFRRRRIATAVILTGQHRDLVPPVLDLFGLAPDYELDIMGHGSTLNETLSRGLVRIGSALTKIKPTLVVVQGDTTSTCAGALAAFHERIDVAHVEAGLRSHSLEFPFPEEMNRRVVSVVAKWHFAPTLTAARQLRAERASGEVVVTGNTVVDAVRTIVARRAPQDAARPSAPYILATAHRRESWGRPIENIARALRDIVRANPTVSVVFATHPNALARDPVERILAHEPRVSLVGALAYDQFLVLLQGATLAVTDSGGIQEEGPSLGIPVLVTRDVTERPEGPAKGAVRLVGTNHRVIHDAVAELLADPSARSRMSRAGRGLYGDGHAARRIVDHVFPTRRS